MENKSANGQQTIPTFDRQNPEPRVGDVWYNFRAFQEVRVEEVTPDHVVIRGRKRTTVLRKDLRKPMAFKFLRHEEREEKRTPAPSDPALKLDERLVLAAERVAQALENLATITTYGAKVMSAAPGARPPSEDLPASDSR